VVEGEVGDAEGGKERLPWVPKVMQKAMVVDGWY